MPQIYLNTPLQNKIKEIPLISIIEQSEHLFTTLSKNALFKPILASHHMYKKCLNVVKNIYIYSTSP